MKTKKSENEWFRYFRRHLTVPKGVTGPGDDAAVLPVSAKEDWVWTTDALVNGVDFLFEKHTPEMIGRKALAVNLSDAAAMGALPQAFLVTLGIPSFVRDAWTRGFYRGMMKLASEYQVPCIGGDLSKSRELFCSVSLIGKTPKGKAVFRNGARPGDWIGVTGSLGGSILKKQFIFEPRIREAVFLAEQFQPRAMIDISDGFMMDLRRLVEASRVSAEVDLGHIPVSPDAFKLARGQKENALKRALSDGEDFELLFAMPSDKIQTFEKAWRKKFPNLKLSWVGIVKSGKPGIRLTREGQPVDLNLNREGFSHF